MKYCTSCGAANDDDVNNCTNCGAPFNAEDSEPKVETVNTVPQPDQQAETVSQGKNPATLWLVLNIVVTVLCGCFLQIPGIIGIIFSALAMSSFKKGDYVDVEQKVKIARIMFFVGIALGLVINAVGLVQFF